MKPRNIVIIVLVALAIVILFYSFQSGSDSSYTEEIAKARYDRDHFFKTSDQSPITDKANFKGLNYYPADPNYKVIADLQPIESKKVVVLHTNDGKEQRYIEYAYADFKLNDKQNRLLILEGIDLGPIRGKLFVAFGDKTSADETYGAGRYLDVNKVPGSSTMVLDFNKAYNPFCAYNHTYSCPFPPAENLLDISIKAGEKIYQ